MTNYVNNNMKLKNIQKRTVRRMKKKFKNLEVKLNLDLAKNLFK